MQRIRSMVVCGGLLLAAAGCAQAELDAEPQGCQTQQDCAATQRCNQITGRCDARDVVDSGSDMAPQPDLPVVADLGPDQPDAPDLSAPDLDMADMSMPPDMACSPACGANEQCVMGRCEAILPACMPACEAGAVCTQAGCVWPTCQRAGARCDEAMSAQGDFYCVPARADGAGRCFAVCAEEGSAQGCAQGQRCERHASGALVCAEAECSNDAGCAGGTCVAYENGFARCEAAGPVAVGQACDASMASGRCVSGALCVDQAGVAVSGAGTCRKKCDLWGVIAGCSSPQVCVPATVRQGVCASVPRDSFGDMPSEPCMTPGAWCSDGSLCVQGRAQDVCARLCRPERGAQDCRTHVSDVSQCNAYYFPGDRATGGCDLDCSANEAVCGSSAMCQGGVCRRKCSAASVAQDCCAGVRPCPWRCVNDLCE